MAKIIIVSRHLNTSAFQLALALKAQQHSITIITSKDQESFDKKSFSVEVSNIEILTPFKNWSWTEGLKFLPFLLGARPQILHFVLEKDSLSSAEILISAYAKVIGEQVLTTSILEIKKGLGRSNPVRYLIEQSDIVTCPSVDTMAMLRGLNIRSSRQSRGILPPVLNFSKDVTNEFKNLDTWDREVLVDQENLNLAKLLKSKNYVVMPFFESHFDARKAYFKRVAGLCKHYHVVLLGSQASWPLRERKRLALWMSQQNLKHDWIFTGNLTAIEQHSLLAKSKALILAGLPLNAIEMTEYYLRAIRAKATCVLDNNQSTIHAPLWKPGKNCWIVPYEHLTENLLELVATKNLSLDISEAPEVSFKRDMIDAPMNELSRLYNKALALKAWT